MFIEACLPIGIDSINEVIHTLNCGGVDEEPIIDYRWLKSHLFRDYNTNSGEIMDVLRMVKYINFFFGKALW